MDARSFACTSCSDLFPSRNKLFVHVRQRHSGGPVDDKSHPAPSIDTTLRGSIRHEKDIGVLWEDAWVSVFVKPQGLATMSEPGCLLRAEALLLSPEDAARSDIKKAIPAHRLDKETGGLILCSKSKKVDSFLKRQFRERTVRKRYVAVVVGKLEPGTGTIELPLSGQESCTRYEVLQCTPSAQFGHLTTVSLWPVTGRMHQLRRHLQLVGHHIVGEKRYAFVLNLPRDSYNIPPGRLPSINGDTSGLLYLWAVEISFPHPELTDENGAPQVVTVSLSEEPESFQKLRSAEAEWHSNKRSKTEELVNS